MAEITSVRPRNIRKDADRLLQILALLGSDPVAEKILSRGSQVAIEDDEFRFLDKSSDVRAASQDLLQGDLITVEEKDAGTMLASRSVPATTDPAATDPLRGLSEEDFRRCLDVVVSLLACGFPDTWTRDVGHQAATWTDCEPRLAHVQCLLTLTQKAGIFPSDTQKYGELLLGASWYAYEREMYEVARKLVDSALDTFENEENLAHASAVDLSGLIDFDICQPRRALESFKTALSIRKKNIGDEDPFIASSLNNLALAYTEMDELEKAHAIHTRAIDLRLKHDSHRIGNSYSNMASLLLRMGKPDEAEEMLARCPSLKDFTDETFLSTGNPRFSGDMVLLSRIRRRQGRSDEALRLASKALEFRRKVLGNRLKTCDSMYDVASMLSEKGHRNSAIEILKQLVDMADSLGEGEGQLARALYKLSELYAGKELEGESASCKSRALDIRAKLRPEEKGVEYEEASFSKLVVWMLW